MQLATRFAYGKTRSTASNGRTALCGVGELLSEDQLRQFVPSIFAEGAHASRSARYGYIPTISVVRGLNREGFKPVFACEAKARDVGKVGFTKHMIRFRRETAMVDPRLGGTPEIVMVNSHDGSTSYQLLAGFFKFLCANGMVCGEEFAEIRIHHKGDGVRDVIDGAYTVVDNFGRAIESANQMAAKQLTSGMQEAYAESALALKYFDEERQETVAPITAKQLVIPRRHEDSKNDLWTTFNVVQENLVRGGLRGTSIDANGKRRRSTTRAVSGIDGNVKLNRALWTLTEKMAELAS